MKRSKKFDSTYEAFIADPKRKKLVDQQYAELCLSELILELMEKESVSVRTLAKKIGVSPTVIQNIRSGKHSNITLDTLLGLTSALGAKIKLEIGDKTILLKK